MIGTSIAHYRITAKLGAGGMGEVYRATDTKLNREVAIKVLPDAFARDPERMARFEREARVLASLNHPNIAQIFGVEERALVMELVEGDSPKGSIPFDDAWKVALQIADALEYAHEKGVIHRDLKPANVKVTPDGVVKLLDFGLAKAFSGAPESAGGDPSNSPTITLGATVAGTIMGTAAYMAPEQAKGKQVNKRADIWSWGVVLYELLTGDRLFKGEDAADTLAQVLTKEPDLERVPPEVRKLLGRCLEKDPTKRLRDIGDALSLIHPAAESRPGNKYRWFWPGAAACCFLAALGLAFVHFGEKSGALANQTLFQIPVGVAPGNVEFEISPDGRKLAFIAQGTGGSRVWIRPLDSLEAYPLPGAESVDFLPIFWSPDSRNIGFGTPGKLMKIDISGGPPQVICDVADGYAIGGSWNRDGTIIFGTNSGLMRVSASGGAPSRVTALDESRGEFQHDHPVFLPDGRHFLYLRLSHVPEASGIYLGSLDAKPDQQSKNPLVPAVTSPGYVPPRDGNTGFLLFLRQGALLAQPFSPRRLELTSELIPVAEHVGMFADKSSFSASANGVLVYRTAADRAELQLTWLNREGKVLGTVGEAGTYSEVALSPDGKRAIGVRSISNILDRALWLFDFTRGAATRFTFDPSRNQNPVWSPDGMRVVFASNRGGTFNLYEKPADGSENEELLLQSPEPTFPTSWSHVGRFLLYTAIDAKTKDDLWLLPNPAGPERGRPQPFLRTEFNETEGSFSPDGQWVAYMSDESGRSEVYVRKFPGSPMGGRWLVSQNGGGKPQWRDDGRELFYTAPDGTEMSVDVGPGKVFQAGPPKRAFRMPPGATALAVSGDGERILVSTPTATQAVQPPFTVVLNWEAGLKK